MKRYLKIFFIAAAAMVVLVGVFLGYMGLFNTISVEEKMMGPYSYAYEKFIGPYSDTGSVFASACKKIDQVGVKRSAGIGVYYDNPAEVESSKLRSDCGALVDASDFAKLKSVQGLLLETIPVKTYLFAEFPIKNSLSYMIGPMAVYPAFSRVMDEKGYVPQPSIELYDMERMKILYLMPIVKK